MLYILSEKATDEHREYLAYNAGYVIDFAKISSEDMLEASARAYACEYDMMERIITVALSEQK